MRKMKVSLKGLTEKFKQEIMEDRVEIEKIEKRIEERYERKHNSKHSVLNKA
jgi:hypothetical protein